MHVDQGGPRRTSCFIVCDGHSGPEVAKMATDTLFSAICSSAPDGLPDFEAPDRVEAYAAVIRRSIAAACVSLDNQSMAHQTAGAVLNGM